MPGGKCRRVSPGGSVDSGRARGGEGERGVLVWTLCGEGVEDGEGGGGERVVEKSKEVGRVECARNYMAFSWTGRGGRGSGEEGRGRGGAGRAWIVLCHVCLRGRL